MNRKSQQKNKNCKERIKWKSWKRKIKYLK